MKRDEANRLRDIANELDDYSYDICHKDGYNKQVQMFHLAAYKIRELIMDSGFDSFIDTKYIKTKQTNWELDKEE